MRAVTYRGWTGKEWIFGDLLTEKPDDPLYYIRFTDGEGDTVAWGVDPNSIGESCGLKDKNGVEIYEGDVVGFKVLESDNMSVMREVSYKKGSFVVNPGLLNLVNERCEVIGNIHENPELLTPTNNTKEKK